MTTSTLSTITCPSCGHRATEMMPVDACQTSYECKGCGIVLRPKPGRDCIFCSYGDVACPPVQARRAASAEAGTCCGACGG
ncbi:GDCCVxC domain-containing (seleno)protein [Rhodoblastus sp. 17X3]|uniref:GDCCVxC domain-containing (seleno)protein n=1 Tax=Rhodoblastus sp. 17X3 TaxID=3047026 RepID=UPI0024B6F33C|nr:GDCCVxC domain-containing (seleno)protein [Rhodoblastus sp. 17X3]MDI9847427.1 GDCCVxC domain-containing (seleno)protein [Rhodoblastus sp. 17X3]